jgi:hypothetical protein
MKSLLAVLFALVAGTLTALVPGAAANGSPYSPGLVYGWPGVGETRDGPRLVAFGMPKSTIVAAVRARDGHVLMSRVVRGFYGVPLVAYDGTAGGLSGDGTSLVLSSYGPQPGSAGRTRFVVLNVKTLTVRRTFVLDGSWSFDAISPNGSTLYLTQHVRAGDDPLYRVRPLDARTGLLRGPIVDRLENEEEMGGVPVARASSPTGRWAYTLYARRGDHPFVHALDTAKREAFCIDLPLRLDFNRQSMLRLELSGRALSVRLYAGRKLATVDTATWEVRR